MFELKTSAATRAASRSLSQKQHINAAAMMPLQILLLTLLLVRNANGFVPPKSVPSSLARSDGIPRQMSPLLQLTPVDVKIGIWTAAFSASHIGMSAIRRQLIDICGNVAGTAGLVNRTDWRLPDIWPGDASGGQEIFPTTDIAGRQLYRLGYTAISFATLGSAFLAYLESLQQQPPMNHDSTWFVWIATASWAVSIASLFNPSPLSLVPVFVGEGQSNMKNEASSLIARNDAQKLQATGMTRITRHPLILPVVPWGLATAMSMGGQTRDFLFFGGLAMYAIAGCAAQDLRVIREEGSVGTVFAPGATLQDFFDDTSFLPFGAVLDGRQSLSRIATEVPWWALGLGVVVGYNLQLVLLDWLLRVG
ncbi:NnrU protein [Seminavis robusta]|uniref:NnrU protein n=1 Tax=Seminavis robusta TaxID=568900 RepID=A0A9N8ESN7_9STRA|nr:NnrU protein [Seminavis robusta]|eukprot:Sro1664_g289490.1 NnrU protein (365) ;mRNA; f:13336-14430